jgi:hypothetical protein
MAPEHYHADTSLLLTALIANCRVTPFFRFSKYPGLNKALHFPGTHAPPAMTIRCSLSFGGCSRELNTPEHDFIDVQDWGGGF